MAAVPGEARRPLVPDVSYVAEERLSSLTDDEAEVPALAPNVAVEILSPHDELRDVASKIETYLAGGCELVVIVNPMTRTVALHDSAGVRELSERETLRHEALPDFELALGPLFLAALNRGARVSE